MNFNQRLKKVIQKLEEKNLNAVLISSIPNIIYLTGISHFSAEEREAFFLVTKNESYLLTDMRYTEEIKSKTHNFKLLEVSSKLPWHLQLEKSIIKHKIEKLGIEENSLSIKEYKTIYKYIKLYSDFDFIDLRIIKEKGEILEIKKACEATDKAFYYILKNIKPNISEKELAIEIEYFIKKQGADISFSPIVAFGRNSSTPHHKPSDRKLKKHEIILLDFGAKVDNYCSDITRTIFFGKPTTEQIKAYQTVLESQQKAIDLLKNETIEQFNNLRMKQSNNKFRAFKIDKAARDYITSQGYPSIPHSLGHGIGIEIHEFPKLSPNSKDILKPGMVFSIEPGIYLEGKFGIRIEDTVVLEKKELNILTKSPKKNYSIII